MARYEIGVRLVNRKAGVQVPQIDFPGIRDVIGVLQCFVRGDLYLEHENGTEAGEGQQGDGGNRGYGSQGDIP